MVLMQKMGAADQAAFRVLYDRFSDRLYRYALYRLRSPVPAQDAVQDTLLAVWKDGKRYTGASSLSIYIFDICHHKVSDLLRSESRRRKRTVRQSSQPLNKNGAKAPFLFIYLRFYLRHRCYVS